MTEFLQIDWRDTQNTVASQHTEFVDWSKTDRKPVELIPDGNRDVIKFRNVQY